MPLTPSSSLLPIGTLEPKEVNSLSKFTWKQVAAAPNATEASERRLLLVIRDKVYDATEWRERHPGGHDVLDFSAGRDVTQLFEAYHSEKAEAVLKKYLVGTLVDKELPTFPETGKFYKTLKKRVQAYFDKTNQDPKYSHHMLQRYIVLGASVVSLYIAYLLSIVYSPKSWLLSLLVSPFLGFCCALVCMMPIHDSSHFSFGHSRSTWRYMGAIHDFLNGCSWVSWVYQHLLGHHPYTNVIGADPDISTNEVDIRRIKSKQPWLFFYIGQHIYAPILYVVLALKTRLSDGGILFYSRKQENIRINNLSTYHKSVFVLGKLFFLFYRFAVPTLLPGGSLARTITCFLVADAINSWWLALIFQANHVVTDVEFYEPDSKGCVQKDWAELQLATTQDYAHGDWFWTVFTGNLNYQVAHHLFPQVCQYYYPEITPVIQEVCKEFGIKYNYRNTFWEALGSHLGHLRHLGLAEDLKVSKKLQ